MDVSADPCRSRPHALLLDLIALEPCPVTAVDCGWYVPFTLQIGRRGDPGDSSDLAIAAGPRTLTSWSSAPGPMSVARGCGCRQGSAISCSPSTATTERSAYRCALWA